MRPVVADFLRRALGPWAAALAPTYVALLALGCVLGAAALVEEARRQGYARRDTLAVLMVAYVGALVGAGAVPVVQGLVAWLREGRFALPTGIAAYGGMIGGVAAGAWALRRRALPVAPFLDATAPSIPLGYFCARLGCLMAGCDYGRPTSLPWALRFPRGSHAWRDHAQRAWIAVDAPTSLPVHPTQLYSAFAGVALFLALRAAPARGDGRRFVALVLGYGLVRAAIETTRGDASRGAVGPLSTSQTLALLTSATAVALWLRARRAALLPSDARGTPAREELPRCEPPAPLP